MTEAVRNRRILVIDDNEKIHDDFRAILNSDSHTSDSLSQAKSALFADDTVAWSGPEYVVDSAFQGREGLSKLQDALTQGKPYVLAFVDMRMPPGWDGIETIQRLWKAEPGLQVVICTAYSDYSWSDTIRELGQTDRLLIIKKPFDPVEIRQMAYALTEKWHLIHDLDRIVREQTQQIYRTRDVTMFALANLAESRDPETGEHLQRLRAYCQLLAETLRRDGPYADQIDDSFLEHLYRSSPMHDIGKVGIPDKVLLKPGPLSDREFDIMKQHVSIGADTLAKTLGHMPAGGFLQMAVDITRYHHEHFDGEGYLAGLEGQAIPLSARIVALADVFDALTSARVYKRAFQPEIVKMMIEEERGKQFDPVIVDAFSELYDQFIQIYTHTAPEPVTM